MDMINTYLSLLLIFLDYQGPFAHYSHQQVRREVLLISSSIRPPGLSLFGTEDLKRVDQLHAVVPLQYQDQALSGEQLFAEL
jgi:hypothetical protein